MKTQLIFFDRFSQSKKGTMRGLTALLVLLILNFIWYGLLYQSLYSSKIEKMTSRKERIGVAFAILIFFLPSALAVQLPSSLDNALLYGFLVGTVIYSISNAVLMLFSPRWDLSISFIDTLFGALSCSLASGVVYKMFF